MKGRNNQNKTRRIKEHEQDYANKSKFIEVQAENHEDLSSWMNAVILIIKLINYKITISIDISSKMWYFTHINIVVSGEYS